MDRDAQVISKAAPNLELSATRLGAIKQASHKRIHYIRTLVGEHV